MRLSGLGDLVNACYAVPQNPLRPADAPCLMGTADLWPRYLAVVSRVSAAVDLAPYGDMWPDLQVSTGAGIIGNDAPPLVDVGPIQAPGVIPQGGAGIREGGLEDIMPDITTCQRIQCGALPASQAGMDLVMACAQAGYVGARVCTDPICSPFKQEMSDNGYCPPYIMPRPTPQVVPSIVATAQRASNSLPDSQVLSPRSLLGPLPQIVTPAPLPQAVPMCSGLTAWVATNPILAIAALGLLAFGLLGKKN